jgi:flagellar biogenesis protein FliO
MVSALAVWLFVALALGLVLAIVLLVRAAWVLVGKLGTLGREMNALQDDLDETVGSRLK